MVADCCVERLDYLYTSGIYLTRDYGLPLANSTDDARLSSDAIEKNVARLQEAVAKADAISKKAGRPQCRDAQNSPLYGWNSADWSVKSVKSVIFRT